MDPDPRWTWCLEGGSWSLVDPSLACLTEGRSPLDSCLQGAADQTMVNKQFLIKLHDRNDTLLLCACTLVILHGR